MAITSLPGLPAPLALIWAAIGAAWFLASVEKVRVAALFSVNEPALGAALKTSVAPAPAGAGGGVPAAERPWAALLLPVLVRWTTSSTITTTPTTEESR